MSREIKFRAWVKPIKKMAEVTGWVNDSVFLKAGTGSGSNDLENVELMQYTGLRDRNGKEIYEGDILKLTDPALYPKYVHTVEWSDYQAKFIISGNEKKDATFYRTRHVETDFLSFRGQHGNCGVEIIGNIYENSELLK